MEPAQQAPPARDARLIPIAGGKGGIGKSILTANLGIALAALGHETVVVDLDLGGSNLHSYLGLSNGLPGIGDFVHNVKGRLEDYLHPTRYERLRFLPGDGLTPFLANLSYSNKARLATRLHEIRARYVLLDLGAGSAFNTLDFFSMSPHGMLITTRERPALMGMLVFMKNFILRMIDRSLKDREVAYAIFQQFLLMPAGSGSKTVALLREQLMPLDEEAARRVDAIVGRYRPRIVLNEALHPDDLTSRLAHADQAMHSVLSIRADPFGVVFDDDAVTNAVDRGIPLLEDAPDSIAATNIATLAGSIANSWDTELNDAFVRLLAQTKSFYEKLRAEP